MTIFEQFKTEYLNKALKPIHYKKLKKRIHDELSAHMDDMYEDLSNEIDDELEIVNKIREEMGSATGLGIELKEANKRKLFVAKLFKIIFAISALPLLISIISLSMFIIDDVTTYFYADSIEEREQLLSQEYNNGEPIRFLFETENDGIVYRYYIPEERKENEYTLFHTESIKVLGINIKDKFGSFSASSGSNFDNIYKLYSDAPHNGYFIFVGPTEEKYIKLYYEPIDRKSNLEPYWSDFIAYPQNGTYEKPVAIFMKCPDGYYWSNYEIYDENKNIYRPESKTDVNDSNSNGIKIHSSTVTH